MKTKLSGIAAALAIILSTTGASVAETGRSVATGTVISLAPERGTLAVRAGSSKPLVFTAVDRANVVTTSGREATLGNVRVGLPVTLYYVAGKKSRMATRIIIPDTIAPQVTVAPSLTPAEVKALQSPAANDGDITTEPGVKARIDDDITTQAGKNALADPDITKRPR
jgi:hypothetical protein